MSADLQVGGVCADERDAAGMAEGCSWGAGQEAGEVDVGLAVGRQGKARLRGRPRCIRTPAGHRDPCALSLAESQTLAEILGRNHLPEVLRDEPEAVIPHLIVRNDLIKRVHRYWQPDGEGIEDLSPADWVLALDLLAAGDEDRYAATVRKLLDRGHPAMAFRVVELGLRGHEGSQSGSPNRGWSASTGKRVTARIIVIPCELPPGWCSRHEQPPHRGITSAPHFPDRPACQLRVRTVEAVHRRSAVAGSSAHSLTPCGWSARSASSGTEYASWASSR
jgi:hypothetical protein